MGGSGGSAGKGGAGAPGAAGNVEAPADLVLFVTRTSWRGHELGSLSGADAKCTQQGATLGGPFIALLSDSSTSARSRMPPGRRIVNPLGATILQNSSDFFPLRDYRAVGIESAGTIAWFWIGPHKEYEKLVAR